MALYPKRLTDHLRIKIFERSRGKLHRGGTGAIANPVGSPKMQTLLSWNRLEVITDHQPLIGIMNGRNLAVIQNMRIYRLMSKLLGYRFKVRWTPGKTQCIADALSQSPVFEAEEKADILVYAA